MTAGVTWRLPLDQPTLQEAREAAVRFVDGPWSCTLNKVDGAQGSAPAALPNGNLAGALTAAPTAAPAKAPAPTVPASVTAPRAAAAPAATTAPMTPAPSVAPVAQEKTKWADEPEEDDDEVPEELRQAEVTAGVAHEAEPVAADATPEVAETKGGLEEVAPTPAAPATSTPSAALQTDVDRESVVGRSPKVDSFQRPPNRSWANIAAGREEKFFIGQSPSSGSTAGVSLTTATENAGGATDAAGATPSKPRKDTIVDVLLDLARRRTEEEARGETELPADLPPKFRSCLERGLQNVSVAKYFRRGMKNDANNCYMNVVIQSLLPCSALMQLLSHCASSDNLRPFYCGMQKLCKAFHSKPDPNEGAFNVLMMPQVTEIINRWQSIGAQQDAGEFLFYMLEGMHEECKWKVAAPEPEHVSSPAGGPASEHAAPPPEAYIGDPADASQADDVPKVGKRKIEIRSSGVHEDSPINRIFGGLVRSAVRSQNATADSVSVEPFNHLILDVSAKTVDSVWTALEAYCGAEAVDEGRATKRLQFKLLPKVLIVNLKRFAYNKEAECPMKIKKAIKYEDKLVFDRNWLVDGVEPQHYQLTAVICHHGDSANGGHYNAVVKYNTEWYIYDDAVVRQIAIDEVMNQQCSAYLLIYLCSEKVDIRP